MSTIKGEKSNRAYCVYYALERGVYCVVLAGVDYGQRERENWCAQCATVEGRDNK